MSQSIRYSNLSIDPEARRAYRDSPGIRLSPRETSILSLFLAHPGEVLALREIRFLGFEGQEISDNSIRVHIHALRRKLGLPYLIHTVRGVGYVLREK